MNGIETFLLYVMAPTVLLLSLVEAVVLARRGGYDWKGMGVSHFDFVLRIAVQLALPFSIAAPLVWLTEQHRVATLGLTSIGEVLLLFIGVEFFY